MIRVGITGGIGSGKSTVAKVFEVLGIPVYYADDAAKKLMNEDVLLKAALIENFGALVYTDGKLNRQYLSSLVFNDADKLSLLNSIVHPATIKDAANWMQQQQAAYAIKEAALIFESGAEAHLDVVIGVSAPPNLRIQRVMKRDGISKAAVEARMNKQLPEAAKMKLCDYIIFNDEQQSVLLKVNAVHQKILGMIEK